MKKLTEKPPIDELFARKLGNMSLPPSLDGFERLQARMGQREPEAKVVFWRNSDLQRYMAAAACLLLVCLFGWLYWPSGKTITPIGEQVATNQGAKFQPKKSAQPKIDQQSGNLTSKGITPDMAGQKAVMEQVAVVDKPTQNGQKEGIAASQRVVKTYAPEINKPILAQTTPVKSQNTPDVTTPANQPSVNQPMTEQLTENKLLHRAPAQATERVLDVTIAEPEALVAARQVATESIQEKPVLAATETQPKEARGFWQQVKRIKQGEVFARHDNPANDERGLLGRAYSGLKQSFDKDKSAKQ